MTNVGSQGAAGARGARGRAGHAAGVGQVYRNRYRPWHLLHIQVHRPRPHPQDPSVPVSISELIEWGALDVGEVGAGLCRRNANGHSRWHTP